MNRLCCMRLAEVQYYIKGRYEEQRARCGRFKILLLYKRQKDVFNRTQFNDNLSIYNIHRRNNILL